MTGKIFRSILVCSAAALLACLIIVTGVLYGHFAGVQKSRLRTELALTAAAVEQSGEKYLTAVDADGYRLTWVAADGTVLFDSAVDAALMENHADREEIAEAFEGKTGESERYSATLTEKTFYGAVLLSDGTVLRISTKSVTVLTLVLGMLQPIFVVILFVLILAGILAKRMAKRIVGPLNELDLEHPLENDAYDELSPLLRRIEQLRAQVDSQLLELHRKTDEFKQITGSMNEGLVLLDDKGRVLSINDSAMRLFGIDEPCVGRDFQTIDRDRILNTAIQSAMTSGHGEVCAERDGFEYQYEISRIESDGSVIGAVLLAFDVTDRVFAERNRREFTANVSHELKTPLQSIMGSAELMENGLVKPADMPRFVGHIRTEAVRLVALIEDIIRLSQLDEKNSMPCEDTDLFRIAKEVLGELEYTADAKNISLSLTGSATIVNGVHKLLYEIVFNLCDNAIKYNTEGGRVDVSVSEEGKNAVITVKDTGIGIPPESQNRVFERFYRVDKSHSKESGGTGLGLSIVKHAVAYHHGTVALRSSVGKGSEFTVTLPLSAAPPDTGASLPRELSGTAIKDKKVSG